MSHCVNLPVDISGMTHTTGHILVSWIHNSDHDSVDACWQALVAHINISNISDCEPNNILTIRTSVWSKCILSVSIKRLSFNQGSPELVGPFERSKFYLRELFGGGDKASSVSISEIVEIGHLVLLLVIKEFNVKRSISNGFDEVWSTIELFFGFLIHLKFSLQNFSSQNFWVKSFLKNGPWWKLRKQCKHSFLAYFSFWSFREYVENFWIQSFFWKFFRSRSLQFLWHCLDRRRNRRRNQCHCGWAQNYRIKKMRRCYFYA